MPFSRVLYIEHDDFMEDPPKKFFRLSPGKEVRLRCAYFITCTEVVKDDRGEIVELRCTYDPATRGGDSPDGRRVKATLHWVSAAHAHRRSRCGSTIACSRSKIPSNVPEGKTFLDYLNPHSLEVLRGLPGRAEPRRRRPGDALPVRAPRLLLRRSRFARRARSSSTARCRCATRGRECLRKAKGSSMMRRVAGIALACALTAAHAAAQQVVRYTPAEKDLKFVYATVPPVATLKPGDTLDTNTVDAFGNVIQKPGDTMAMVKGDNPLTGPFAIAGAEPGDTLVGEDPRAHRRFAARASARSPPVSARSTPRSYTPMLNANLPEKVWFYDIDARANQATFHALDSNFSVNIPLQPFLGCIGVAPAGGEARSSIVPAEFGGNMDAHEGASRLHALSSGQRARRAALHRRRPRRAGRRRSGRHRASKCRCACACRWISSNARRSRGRDSRTTPRSWPSAPTVRWTMRSGSRLPSWSSWIHADYGLSELDAYELLSKVAKIHLVEMVDPNYVVIAGIDKRYLPKK